MDTDGDNANANETKGAQEGIVTDASASSSNANADVKSVTKSDEISKFRNPIFDIKPLKPR